MSRPKENITALLQRKEKFARRKAQEEANEEAARQKALMATYDNKIPDLKQVSKFSRFKSFSKEAVKSSLQAAASGLSTGTQIAFDALKAVGQEARNPWDFANPAFFARVASGVMKTYETRGEYAEAIIMYGNVLDNVYVIIQLLSSLPPDRQPCGFRRFVNNYVTQSQKYYGWTQRFAKQTEKLTRPEAQLSSLYASLKNLLWELGTILHEQKLVNMHMSEVEKLNPAERMKMKDKILKRCEDERFRENRADRKKTKEQVNDELEKIYAKRQEVEQSLLRIRKKMMSEQQIIEFSAQLEKRIEREIEVFNSKRDGNSRRNYERRLKDMESEYMRALRKFESFKSKDGPNGTITTRFEQLNADEQSIFVLHQRLHVKLMIQKVRRMTSIMESLDGFCVDVKRRAVGAAQSNVDEKAEIVFSRLQGVLEERDEARAEAERALRVMDSYAREDATKYARSLTADLNSIRRRNHRGACKKLVQQKGSDAGLIGDGPQHLSYLPSFGQDQKDSDFEVLKQNCRDILNGKIPEHVKHLRCPVHVRMTLKKKGFKMYQERACVASTVQLNRELKDFFRANMKRSDKMKSLRVRGRSLNNKPQYVEIVVDIE